jgi:hypothetical protein
MSNAEMLGQFDQWARDRKISPKSFACPHYEDCDRSLRVKGLHLDRGNTCQMSYVGREYGELELMANKPFRLVIAGIDAGANYEERNLESFSECQENIETYFYGTGTHFNSHYRGVVRTAAAILGEAGKNCLDHCWPGARCEGEERPPGKQCVLRLFAQPNLVKCAPAENKDRSSKSTPVMFRNCPRHLLSELEVLKPDLIVFHGRKAEWAFPNAMDKERYEFRPLPDSPKYGVSPMVHELIGPDGSWKCSVLFLLHPSHHGLDRQWKSSVVEQALELLRRKEVIPKA